MKEKPSPFARLFWVYPSPVLFIISGNSTSTPWQFFPFPSHGKSRWVFLGVCPDSSQSWAVPCCMGFKGMCKTWENTENSQFNKFSQRIKRIASAAISYDQKRNLIHMCSSGLNLPSKLSLTSPWRGEMECRSLGCRSWFEIMPALRGYSPNMLQSFLCFTSKHTNNVFGVFSLTKQQAECVQEIHRNTYCWQNSPELGHWNTWVPSGMSQSVFCLFFSFLEHSTQLGHRDNWVLMFCKMPLLQIRFLWYAYSVLCIWFMICS